MTIAQQLFVSNVVTFPDCDSWHHDCPRPPLPVSSPPSGSLAGGNSVTITGTNLLEAQTVTFGGTPATSFLVNNSTSITATVPPSTTLGPASIVVTTLVGSNPANMLYTYVSLPMFTSISPASGPIAGGTKVTITGSGFTGSTVVTFAGTNATSFTVVNDTTITAISPMAFEAGLAQVDVTTPGGVVFGYYTYSATASASDRPGSKPVIRRRVN